MALCYSRMTTRENKISQGWKGSFQYIHFPFHDFNFAFLGFQPLAQIGNFCIGGQVGAYGEKLILNANERLCTALINGVGANHPQMGVQFVHGAIGFQSVMVLRHPCAPNQSRSSLVARFGIHQAFIHKACLVLGIKFINKPGAKVFAPGRFYILLTSWLRSSRSISPSRRRSIRCACKAISSSWVTNIMVLPPAWMSAKSRIMSMEVFVSRLPVGSSAKMMAGLLMRALATATR